MVNINILYFRTCLLNQTIILKKVGSLCNHSEWKLIVIIIMYMCILFTVVLLPIEQEPLYQHINHLDFTSTPWLNRNTKISKDKGSNQLEIARQLSVCHRKLWCEQPEVHIVHVLYIIILWGKLFLRFSSLGF